MKLNNLSIHALRQRWQDHISWIGEEANYMAGHQTRYRLIEKWLFRSRSSRWVNRHLQAYGWISKLWLNEGLMSVRRQLDGQHGSISLEHLLHEIKERPEVLGLSTAEVASDQQALKSACAEALMFAQRQLAHRVPWDDAFVSISALDRALDAINDLARKYYLAVYGQELELPEPEPDPSWLRSFEVPWYMPQKRRSPRSSTSSPSGKCIQNDT